MPTRVAFPADVASVVASALKRRGVRSPGIRVIKELLNTMFFVSLETEEGQAPRFEVIFADPDNPDPDPPERLARDRFTFVRFLAPIPFRSPELTKLARATDFRSSSLAAYTDSSGDLQVWGMVDQGTSFDALVNWETEGGFARPGVFQATVLGGWVTGQPGDYRARGEAG